MNDQPATTRAEHIKAAGLYEKGRKLVLQRDYDGAIRCYRESLALHEDETVKAEYFDLLATRGPK